MFSIPALEKLVQELSRLPGVGPKSAQRLAYHILKSTNGYPERLAEALMQVRLEVHDCPRCFSFTDRAICQFCSDPHRTDEVLCIVEEPSDILRIESSGAFKGRYHVLHGALSPLDGIGPGDLKIAELLSRINSGLEGKTPVIKEIILALDADLEGDTTVLYLTKLLSERARSTDLPAAKKLRLSRIAHGVPIGGDIDYVDDRTMSRALENRVEL
jgi:recombination protein RecR